MKQRTRFAEQFVLAGLTAEHVGHAMLLDQLFADLWDAIEVLEAAARRNAALTQFVADTTVPIDGRLH